MSSTRQNYLKNLKIANYPHISEPGAFCRRNGVYGFHYGDPTQGTLAPHVASFENLVLSQKDFPKIDIVSVPTVRVRLKRGPLTKYRLPQLLGYLPTIGWPCSNKSPGKPGWGARTSSQSKLSSQFVQIPIQHLLYMLGGGEPCHQLTVFKSIGEPFDWAVGFSEFKSFLEKSINDPTFMGSKVRPLGTNKLEDSLSFTNATTTVTPELYEEYLRLEKSHALSPNTTLMSNLLQFSGSNLPFSKVLNFQEFEKYLPFWMLFYPHKWMSIKDPYASAAGKPPEVLTSGDNPGYIDYTRYPTCDLLTEYKNDLSEYYGLPGLEPLIPQSKCFSTRGKLDTCSFQWKRTQLVDHEVLEHPINGNISEDLIKAFTVARSSINALGKSAKSELNWYPFKSSPQTPKDTTYPLGTDSHFLEKDYAIIERIICLRRSLDSSMELVTNNATCPKCLGPLVVPRRLQGVKSSNIVCWDCGLQYLVNYVNSRHSGHWLYFEDYSVEEAFY